jgi:hypothetical protein
VPDNQELKDYWPALNRLRHALIRSLPANVVNRASRIKALLLAQGARA